MCTAISFNSGTHYFGRNLDLEYCYQETVTITPRYFPFHFRAVTSIDSHYGLIGIATISDNYPLYYDATNEKGLSMAGLNFPGNAFYGNIIGNKHNIAAFELIPWVLTQCKTVKEAQELLNKTNICDISFSHNYPTSPLHWLISDKEKSLVIEPMKDGLHIIDNPFGVLTNNPPFDYHLYNIINYLNLTETEPKNSFAPSLSLEPYSRGMGAIGLPGDLSSASRFVRAAFIKNHCIKHKEELPAVSQFFHILSAVEQQEGCVRIADSYEKTIYSSCCNTDTGTYYYKTYENNQITAVHMHRDDLMQKQLISYPLIRSQQIKNEN